MPQVQRQIARLPQRQRSFNPNRGLGRTRAGMNPDVSVSPRMRPPVSNTAAVEQRVFTPPPATNTAATIDQTARRNRFEPRTGQTDEGARANRDRGTNDLRNRTPDEADRILANRQTQTGEQDVRNHEGRRRGGGNRHRDWHNRHEGDSNFADKHRRYHRQQYNREWWRRNYTRFALFGGGYYYWNSGYWYPAYGYDPYYSNYSYDAPLYSYDGLPPGQIISRVQAELQRRGYYRAAVDGSFGPQTRQALMNYQADVGLPMTGEIDEETLNSFELQ